MVPTGISNMKSSDSNKLGMTRLLREVKEIYKSSLSLDVPFLNSTDTDEIGIRLSPIKGNLLEFHFSFTGIEGSAYEGGLYHGRIFIPPEYPRKAPTICMLTPTGRWEVGKPICLSASAYHPETWDPNWNLRTLVMALRTHILTQPREIGAISTSIEYQKRLASLSRSWLCPICGVSHSDLLPGTHRKESSIPIPSLLHSKASILKDKAAHSITFPNHDEEKLDRSYEHMTTSINDVEGRRISSDSKVVTDLATQQNIKKLRKLRREQKLAVQEKAEKQKLLRKIVLAVVWSLSFMLYLFYNNFVGVSVSSSSKTHNIIF